MKQDMVQATTSDALAVCDHPRAERVFQWIRLNRVRDFLAMGWMVALPNAIMHHHVYSVLMEMRCCCGKMARPR